MFFVLFNKLQDNKDLGIMAISRPNIPIAKRKINEIEVPGRDGKLIEDMNCYEDMNITVSYNFRNREEFHNIGRKIKKWVNKIVDNKLQFSDDLEFFYKVKYASIEVIERKWKTIGRFDVVFTIEAYSYLVSGTKTITLQNNSNINNMYEKCKPVYMITGEGLVTLNINNKIVKVNLGQNLIIDTDKRLCYRDNGEWRNSDLTGFYEDLWFEEGVNLISWSGGTNVNIKVIPNWRTL